MFLKTLQRGPWYI